jgi:DNA-binding beta-propeller fold protein YncE
LEIPHTVEHKMALKRLLLAVLAASLTGIASSIAPTLDSEQQRSAQSGGRLYYLVQGLNGRIASLSTSGGSPTTVLSGLRNSPDGIAVDKAAGYIYFSNMTPGTIMRASINGTGLRTLVSGKFRVGKQLVLVVENGTKKLYWADREGMKVMRSNIDGSGVETVVDTSRDACTGAQCKHAVGVAVDARNGWVYWTQKGAGGTGSIHRAPTRVGPGEKLTARTGLQTILRGLPEPIDMRWVDGYGLYWTDRGHRTGGNSVNRMKFSAEAIAGKAQFPARPSTLVTGLTEAIGIAVSPAAGKMWFTDLGGHVYQANLDGTGKRTLASGQGIVVGIDYVP